MRNIFILSSALILSLNIYGQPDNARYRLTLDTIILHDVSVTGTVPLNSSQVEKFYRTSYFSTIDDLTGRLEGISLIKRGAYAMEPQLNGFSAGQVNITIDGMKMFGACTDKMDPVTSYLEPGNLSSITIEHGTNGGLHGNNVGGSIDLALNEPATAGMHPFSTALSYGYESVSNSRNILISTGYRKGKWSWGLNGVRRINDLYRDGKNNKIEYSQFEKYNIHSVLKYAVDTLSGLRADLLWDLAENAGYPALPMDVSKARAALFALEYQRTRPLYFLKSKLYYNTVYHVMDDSARDSIFFLENGRDGKPDSVVMRMDMPGWSSTLGAYFQADINISSKNKLTVKADNYMNSSLAEMTMRMHFIGEPPETPMYLQTWPGIKRNVTGFYINNSTTLNDKVVLNLNARVDYIMDKFQSAAGSDQFSVFGIKMAPKYSQLTRGLNFSVKYHVFKPVIFSLETGISERIPTITEQYGFYLYNAYDGYDYIGNPDLSTEKSAAARFSLIYFNQGLKINFTQSFSYLTDYIMGITDPAIPPMNFYTNGVRVFGNLPYAIMHGSDLQVMYKLSSGFTFFLQGKFTWGQLYSGKPLPLIPPYKNIFSISYEKGRWSFRADNETALPQSRINQNYGETASSGYTLLNIKTNIHFMLKSSMLDCSAGITNLLNAWYYEHLDWGHIPRPGRSFNVFLKYTY